LNKLVAVVRALADEDIPVELALRDTDISPSELDSPASRMFVSQLLVAYRNALTLSRRSDFAIRLGQSIQVTAYGFYGYALMSSPNQRTLINTALKYHHLMLATEDLSFREDSENKIGIWTIKPIVTTPAEHRLYRFIVEVKLATLLALSSDILERPQMRQGIRVTYPYSPDLPPYEELFRCPIQYGQDSNELILNAIWLDTPTRRHNALTFAAVEKICAETLDHMGDRTGLGRDIKRIFLESAGRFPTIEEISEQLETSPRTLRRKLQSEGTSYAALLNETRVHLAKKYLRETILTIDEIANLVGYNETSNFRRGFQRATGVSPTTYRGRIQFSDQSPRVVAPKD
jgi:AraC-like DNA-binding protein